MKETNPAAAENVGVTSRLQRGTLLADVSEQRRYAALLDLPAKKGNKHERERNLGRLLALVSSWTSRSPQILPRQDGLGYPLHLHRRLVLDWMVGGHFHAPFPSATL